MESGHPCLVPHLGENAFSLAPLGVLPAGGIYVDAFYQMFTVPFYSWGVECFHQDRGLDFLKCFSGNCGADRTMPVLYDCGAVRGLLFGC